MEKYNKQDIQRAMQEVQAAGMEEFLRQEPGSSNDGDNKNNDKNDNRSNRSNNNRSGNRSGNRSYKKSYYDYKYDGYHCGESRPYYGHNYCHPYPYPHKPCYDYNKHSWEYWISQQCKPKYYCDCGCGKYYYGKPHC